MGVMDSKVFATIQGNLLEKRHNLSEWLRSTPSREKQVRLESADERAVQAHLKVLDSAIEKTTAETLGLCTVCHDYIETELLEMDYTRCVCLDHLSEAERRRLEYELELSQVVQRGLLPQEAPEISGLEVAAFSRPAEIIGGDYFDFFQFGDGGHGLAIGDVAGKGVSASLLMASLQTALRTLVPVSQSPADVLGQVNRVFCHNIHFTTFVTLFLSSFDAAEERLTYSSAGHNPPLVLRKAGNGRGPISWLRPTGAAIGLVEEAQFTLETVTLAAGDVLLLYTDGVTEAINPQQEQFGEERLAALMQQMAHLSARDLVSAVRQELQVFADGQPLADDTTIVACKMAE